MAAQAWIRQTLTEHQIPFKELRHDMAFTAQQLAQLEHVSGHRVAKVVVIMMDGRPLEAVLPASRMVDLEAVADEVGAECRLATEEEIKRTFGDCEVGAVPPMRRWPGVDMLMDESLRTDGDIIFCAGTHRDAIRMKFADWASLVEPCEGHFARPMDQGRRDTGALGDYVDFEA